MCGHCIYMFEDLPVLKALLIFVNNVTFFSMLYHVAVEYVIKYMDLCIHECEMSGQLRASESFFSFFWVEIV